MAEVKQLKVTIDGVETTVPAGSTIIQAAKKVEKFIPHFCYHEGLSVVGQCRMCFVEVEGVPKLQTACSTPVADNMKVLTESPKVKAGQNATLEFTLLNHPLDCPICDRGGECKLQDYTYEYGPPRSRMDDDKHEKDKHRPISAQVVLDQERCILCTRCVRFSSEVDGRAELGVMQRGYTNVLDIFEDRPLESRFSGNVVDLCPVGALTAQDFRFAARPWELKSHDAICTGCNVGCNVEIHTKHRHAGIARPDGHPPIPSIVRLVPRENSEVNTWWICDKGRWGYHFHNELEQRLHRPLIRRTNGASQEAVSLKEVQVLLEQAGQGPWEFWIDDNFPHEGISWVKELMESWSARGRKIKALNSLGANDKFTKLMQTRASSPWWAGPAEWTNIKVVVSPYSYRELETIAPILALRLGQNVRKGLIEWKVTTLENLSKVSPSNEIAFLVSPPTSVETLKQLEALSPQAQLLILWTRANSRGLVNEGIAPIESLHYQLHNLRPEGPVFYFGQRTQNPQFEAFNEYLLRAPFLAIADSFESPLSAKANVVLPLTPLYESRATLTNLENRRQLSKGVEIHHPNYPSVERGGPVVHPSLRFI